MYITQFGLCYIKQTSFVFSSRRVIHVCAVYFSKYNGSYKKERFQYLQKSIVPTMHFQKSLPRLPIPELDKTCDRYLASLKPIIAENKLKNTEKIVNEFRKGVGPVLQDALKIMDKRNKNTSYISGPWSDMYLTSRIPLVLNYNPFMAFKDDPQKDYNNQLLRATNMLISTLRFLKSLREQVLEPEVFHLNSAKSDTEFFRKVMSWLPSAVSWYGAYLFKAFPLDMAQFNNLFSSTRIPQLCKDKIQSFPESRHVVVLRNGHFYVFDALDQDGNILPPSHLYSYLTYILAEQKSPPKHPISSLTTESRDIWASARDYLECLGNADQLRLIDSAIFALVLDEQVLEGDLIQAAHNMLHGPVFNRWFDKSFQLIISKDGKTAINFEHSWGDGVAVLRYFNELYKDSTENHFVGHETLPANIDVTSMVRRLEFTLDEAAKSMIRKALENHKREIEKLQLNVLRYEKMNRDTIKKCKLSPDSICQLGFQMAFYKVYGKFVAAYESCSTAAFKHGRTETVRPVTEATRACVEDFHCQQKPSVAKLRNKLETCTRVHNQLTKEAAMGQGFDRHLFGLKYTAEKNEKEVPLLFQDPVYKETNYFIISTSTLYGQAFSGGGFGPVVEDGFGIAYGFVDDLMGALVSSYSDGRDGGSFVEALHQSYDDIYEVLHNFKS